jgi:hypothetical protein
MILGLIRSIAPTLPFGKQIDPEYILYRNNIICGNILPMYYSQKGKNGCYTPDQLFSHMDIISKMVKLMR